MISAAKPHEGDETYVIVGTDLRCFVQGWLVELDDDELLSRALLDPAGRSYEYGAVLLLADMALIAGRPAASREALLTYAVLAAFQHGNFSDRTVWTTAADHVEHAFAHAAQRGPSGLARSLVQAIVDRSKSRDAWHQVVLHRLLLATPADQAAHDQRIAQFCARDIRAATLLDPTVNLDELLLDQ